MVLDAATTAAMKRELKNAKRAGVKPTPKGAGVLYLGHIPHGFYEEQMRGFFTQFGTVSRLRLARNKKTGRSKHYAFVEFKHAEVAQVVAKSMNGYLLYTKILECHVVPPEDVHPETFKSAGRPFKQVDWTARERKRHNAARSPAEAQAREERLVRKEQQLRRKLADAGIEYEFGGFAAQAARPAKRVRGVRGAEEARKPTPAELAAKKRKAREDVAAGGAAKKRKPAPK